MKRLFARLNLRQNWPLGMAGIALVTALRVSTSSGYGVPIYNPKPNEIVDYGALLNNQRSFPIEWLIVLASLTILLLMLIRGRHKARRWLAVLFLIAANLISCIACIHPVRVSYSNLRHIETIEFGERTYQLAQIEEHSIASSYASYLIYSCEFSSTKCQYIPNLTEARPDFDWFRSHPARLLIDPATNTLYVQIGDERIQVAQ